VIIILSLIIKVPSILNSQVPLFEVFPMVKFEFKVPEIPLGTIKTSPFVVKFEAAVPPPRGFVFQLAGM
jgi:hypothetical protein